MSPASVPPEFRAACGHSGATVKVRKVPVTIRHADCDLTGVTLRYGNAGARVPVRGEGVNAEVLGAAGTHGGGEMSVETDANTGDVTVRD